MDTVELGRTGAKVSVAGLGCGGPSRLGQATGRTEAESEAVVRRALDRGVTLFDTARAYGTEEIVGRALAGRRDDVFICTKAQTANREGPLPPADLRASLEKSLGRLGTDHVDAFFLHGVQDEQYDHCREHLVAELLSLRDEGKVRWLAISEQFGGDPQHAMLQRALPDGCWDVTMVGYNLLNPSARDRVFPLTAEHGTGVLIMFAVRRALSRPDQLAALLDDLVGNGQVDADLLGGHGPDDPPLGFLAEPGVAASVVEAAYRFVRHTPGADVTLTGTGDVTHLEENLASISGGPLPEPTQARLSALFGHLDHITAN